MMVLEIPFIFLPLIFAKVNGAISRHFSIKTNKYARINVYILSTKQNPMVRH